MSRHLKIAVSILAVVLVVTGGFLVYLGIGPHILAEVRIGDPKSHPAYSGTLSIPSVAIELPCIEMDASNYELADLAIEKSKCGARIWYPFGNEEEDWIPANGHGTWIIGDHDSQGFNKIMNCNENDTIYFANADGSVNTYRVMHTHEGAVVNGIFLDRNGTQFRSIENMDTILMTCYPDADVPYEEADRRFFVCLELVVE